MGTKGGLEIVVVIKRCFPFGFQRWKRSGKGVAEGTPWVRGEIVCIRKMGTEGGMPEGW